MAKWTAPVLEELSIPAGTYGSTDDPNGAQDTGFGVAALAPAGRITVAGVACRAPFVCDVAVARYHDVP